MNVIPFAVLACAWVACATQAQAVVVMTLLTPPVYRPFPDGGVETSTHYLIDLNSDGANDFDIVTTGFGMNIVAISTNEIACGFIFGFPEVGGFAQTIHAGAIIGAYQDGYNYDWTPGFGAMVGINGITNPPLIYGYWGSNRDYLGLRFKINGQTHYGWIQMHLPATEGAGFVEGFAYETEPNTAIIAGIPEPSISLLAVMGSTSLLLHRRRKRPENNKGCCEVDAIAETSSAPFS
jgi:hypothetical protein